MGFQAGRAREIRLAREAFWSTGHVDPANCIQPTSIAQAEHQAFQGFHGPTTQIYACVLPGETVQRCGAGGWPTDPGELLEQHLVVDEYQDLNPMDIRFVDELKSVGARLFVAGDDDQSIYSFRFASRPGSRTFRSVTPEPVITSLKVASSFATVIVAAANDLIENNSPRAESRRRPSPLGNSGPARV